ADPTYHLQVCLHLTGEDVYGE
ncbi:MAG: hypothetical protein JWN39_3431, partial [Ilumatobacteraceae bacterium]|nr:hypothetical protein [Ilumatobacteraceae bacterium]